MSDVWPDFTVGKSVCPTCGCRTMPPVVQTEWCPVCHTYHADPGEKTDAGRLIRPCPLLPAGVGANHPINAEP